MILGHSAQRAIKQSQGRIGGFGLMLAGLILGYGSLVLLPIQAAMVLPTMGSRELSKEVQARVATVDLKAALQQYELEYGKLPSLGSDDTTLSGDNSRLFAILCALPGSEQQNPRGIRFFDARRITGPRQGGGMTADGVYYDPWARPYFVRLDGNGDGRVANPYDAYGAPPWIEEKAIFWSYGKDGQPGLRGDGRVEKDVISWK